MARYEAELFIRDFGTHYVTSMVAGAGLTKTDFIKRDFMANNTEDKRSTLVSASASFGKYFQIGSSFGHSTDNQNYESYLKSMTHSFVTSHGGTAIRAFNVSIDEWINNLDKELVPMDKSGDPLSFLVNQYTLPELPIALVHEVEKVIETAIRHYYEMNSVSGCTKLGSPNFSFAANLDDGSCDKETTNMTFGGVYQICNVIGSYKSHNPCTGLSQVNPKTRSYSCPPHFTSVKLMTGRRVGSPEDIRECYSCFWSKCCENRRYVATAVFTSYWCAALEHVPLDSGYLFGGIYSDDHSNAVTGAKNCPPSFYPRVFLEYKVCISDDFEIGGEYSIPFGGFTSCSAGNPLAIQAVHSGGSNDNAAKSTNSLHAFMANNNNTSLWPKHCPKGYSQHLAMILNGCEVRFCVKSGFLRPKTLPKVKVPPFHRKPVMKSIGDSKVIYNPYTKQWIKNEYAYQEKYDSSDPTWASMFLGGDSSKPANADSAVADHSDTSTMSPGLAAAIGALVAICCGLVGLLIYTTMKHKRQAMYQAKDSKKLCEEGVTMSGVEADHAYGAVNQVSSSSD